MTEKAQSVRIEKITLENINSVNKIVDIHLEAFKGFFLTFMGKGFLKCMYSSYVLHKNSDLLIAADGDRYIGFLAYSGDISGLYKFMLKRKFIPFVWFSFLAFLRKPKTFFRIFRALLKPSETKREEKYVQLASLGVVSDCKGKGVGSLLINELIGSVDFNIYKYVSLETDAENNDGANRFYLKNGFVLSREFTTHEGRKMNEYRFYK